MLALSVFAKISGQREVFFPKDIERHQSVSEGRSLINLGEGFVRFDKNTPEVVMLARACSGRDILTWIGIYNHLDQSYSGRSGGYFGAGILLVNTSMPGHEVYRAIKKASDGLSSVLKNSTNAEDLPVGYPSIVQTSIHALSNAKLDNLGLSDDFLIGLAKAEADISLSSGLGSDPNIINRMFIEVREDGYAFNEAIDILQMEPSSELRTFNRAFLTDDARLSATLRGNGYFEFPYPKTAELPPDENVAALEQTQVESNRRDLDRDPSVIGPMNLITQVDPLSQMRTQIDSLKGEISYLKHRLNDLTDRVYEVTSRSPDRAERFDNRTKPSKSIARQRNEGGTKWFVSGARVDFWTSIWLLVGAVLIVVIGSITMVNFHHWIELLLPSQPIVSGSMNTASANSAASSKNVVPSSPVTSNHGANSAADQSDTDSRIKIIQINQALQYMLDSVPLNLRLTVVGGNDLGPNNEAYSVQLQDDERILRSDKDLHSKYEALPQPILFFALIHIERCLDQILKSAASSQPVNLNQSCSGKGIGADNFQ